MRGLIGRGLGGRRFGSRRRDWVLGALLVIALALAYAINAGSALLVLYPRAAAAVRALPELPPIRAGQTVLMVSPHPDDESLCGGGLIAGAVRAGAQVHIVWITSGDGFELDGALLDRTFRPRVSATENLGCRRMDEAAAAAAALGVPADHLTFLGYPDGTLLRMWNSPGPVRSPHTGALRVPYDRALSPSAVYKAVNLRRDLGSVLDSVQPDLVLLPSTSDFHKDHIATSLFTQKALKGRGWTPRARYWIVAWRAGMAGPQGAARGLPAANLAAWLSPELAARRSGTGRQGPQIRRPESAPQPDDGHAPLHGSLRARQRTDYPGGNRQARRRHEE